MRIQFKSTKLAVEATFHEVIKCCHHIIQTSLKRSNDVTSDIIETYSQIDAEQNGPADECRIGIMRKDGRYELQFRIYRFHEHPNVRLVMDCVPTKEGPANVEYIVRLDEELGMITYETVVLKQPEAESDWVQPFVYIYGFASGSLGAFSEFSTPPGYVDPTTNGDDGTDGSD